jgi:hypothetical protein
MQISQVIHSTTSHARGQGFKWANLLLLLLFVVSSSYAFAATTVTTTNLGANQVTLQITSETAGLASLTLLPGASATCGSAVQTFDGKDSLGAAAGTGATAVSAALTGLNANMTYHFRVDATNASGTVNGSDQTFTTLSVPVATQLAFTTAPTATIAVGGNPGWIVIAEEDASGNLVSTATDSITLTMADSGGARLPRQLRRVAAC